MYIPRAFELNDPQVIADVIEANSFGLLVTATGAAPVATHLPFMFDPDRGQFGTLLAHVARANPQWQEFAAYEDGGLALAIFSGPHAYVSPTGYGDNGPTVPSWNYVSVHAYGRPRILDDPAAVRPMLERLVDTNEAGLDPAWQLASQDDDYVAKMMRGIVAFELRIERIEAKAKLSQNKPEAARLGVAAALEGADHPDVRAVGRLMREAPSRE
ncbi:MAG: FMN-binding negative transcriptional regulator [Chloroflexi bacterium]|nr:FMN-binding negative transcriptional regulator [Chloroflexota bacterium]MDA1146350.1 FMN-binding negative transcriptional regulator [Chloroflexota bacterium]